MTAIEVPACCKAVGFSLKLVFGSGRFQPEWKYRQLKCQPRRPLKICSLSLPVALARFQTLRELSINRPLNSFL